MSYQYKRKKLNLSVKREFQMWLLVRILGVVVVSSLVAALILFVYARQEISANFYSAHIQIRRVSDLLLPVMAAGAFISLISGMVLAFFLPQKIAGPVYRIQKSLESIRDGNLTERVKLRTGDTLMDLADSVNETTASLREKIQDVKAVQQELEALVERLESQDARETTARQKSALEQLKT